MTEKDDREPQKAELLWKYIEELKQADNPDDVQFVAITSGECAEVVGVMETAAEAYVLGRAESAPDGRREAVRGRLRAAIAGAALSADSAAPAMAPMAAPRSMTLPAWLTIPLTLRSTGWVVAAAALVAVVWLALPRPQTGVVPLSHPAAVAAIPRLIDGKLGAEETRALWAHLMRCKGCMDLYQGELKAARSASRAARQSRLPASHGWGVRGHGSVVWGAAPGYLWVASAAGPR